MQLVQTERFDKSLLAASLFVQRAFWKQAGSTDIWQARVNRDWRFYFKIIGDKYYLLDITAHPK